MKFCQLTIIGLLFFSTFSYASQISKDMVRKFYENVEMAIESHDMKAVLATISDDAVFCYQHYYADGSKDHYHETKEQFNYKSAPKLNNVKQYNISIIDLKTNSENEAIATVKVDMIIYANGKDNAILLYFTESLKMVAGKLLLVESVSTTRENI